LRGSLRDMVCGGNTPPKGPYTEHEPQKRAERGFARPYGIPYGILAVLVEYRTVLNGRAKSGAFWGIAELPTAVPGGPLSSRRVVMAVLAARSLMISCLEKGGPIAGCVQGILCVQNLRVFSTVSPQAVRKTDRRWGVLVEAVDRVKERRTEGGEP